MQILQTSNLQMTSANKGFAFMSESGMTPTSVLNNRYVCQCSAE